MNKAWVAILLLSTALFVISCEEEPEEVLDYSSVPSLNPDTSTLVLPLAIPLAQLEELANDAMPEQLFEKTDLPAKYKMVVAKGGDLKMKGKKNALYWQVPVKLTLFREGKDEGAFQFAVNLNMKSQITLDDNFGLHSNTQLLSLSWIKRPELSIGFLSLDFTGIIEQKILDQSSDIEQRVDDALSKEVNIEPIVQRVWNKMHNPLRLSKEIDNLSLYVQGQSLSFQQPKIYSNQITVFTKLTCTSTAVWGDDTLQEPVPPLPKPKILKESEDSFNLNFLAKAHFDHIERAVEEALRDESLTYEGMEFKVSHVIIGGFDKELCVTMDLSGDVESKVKLCSALGVDSSTNELKLLQPELTLLEGGVTENIASALFADVLAAYIANEAALNFNTLVEELPRVISQGIEKGKDGEKVDVALDMHALELRDYRVHKSEVHIMLHARGSGTVNLEQLEAKEDRDEL